MTDEPMPLLQLVLGLLMVGVAWASWKHGNEWDRRGYRAMGIDVDRISDRERSFLRWKGHLFSIAFAAAGLATLVVATVRLLEGA